ncbi:SDR family NAD(P)-dependent oxidoreductase [Herpetosiphon gulosus]|uniref:Carrier domain-containing protein n=1 Tax=Herpetosiphon gulosus TaxID=1973496 RepID=A0ABP9X5P8_9CHLR
MHAYTDTDIAIIGMAGRFPGANNLTTFWDNIRQGIVCITDLELQQLQASGIDPVLLNDPAYVKRAPLLLDDIAGFDHSFWGITPNEAALLDPQQRMLLECAWEALEQAGYALKQPQKIGVFVGVGANNYLLQQVLANPSAIERSGDYAVMLANDKDYAPTRISFKLNLLGPSVSVQTACSTSLVATHMAIQSILNGESEMALAGGAALRIPQIQGHLYQTGMIHSPDGNCKPFTSEAAGTIGSSGAGMVLLKRAADAVAAGDPIWAVIKGSAINNDGAQKVGFTAPSIKGQAQVVGEALALAEVEPNTIGYLETHGTATNLGDPIELAALKKVFGATAEQAWCGLGTLKANIGHLDNAAGVAGLIKTALALHHRQLPPTAYANIPHADLQQSPFYLNPTATAWETKLHAGVSSFGIGGTNAHVVLAAAEPIQTKSQTESWQLLPISAASIWSLEQQTERLAVHLQTNPVQGLANVAYTLQTARQAFVQRSFVVAKNHEQASQALLTSPIRECPSQPPKVAWLFSGQGSQYAGMAAELYQQATAFRQAIDLVNRYAQPLLGCDLRQVLFDQSSDLTATNIAQPCLFMLEYALAQQWLAWGIQPQALFGHSIGEYVAACIANVMDLPTAIGLVVARGQLMNQLPSGVMLSISASLDQIQPSLPAELDLAAINTNNLLVVAGEHAAIRAFQQQLTERGIESRILHTSHAFHSRAMQPMLAAFRQQFAAVQLQAPTIPILSNVSGIWMTTAQATSVEYWLEQIVSPVQCAACLNNLLADGAWIVQELGPGHTLATFARASQAAQAPLILTSLPHPQAKQADLALMLQSLGQLWQAGIAVRWNALHQTTWHKVWLPTYAFERQRHWIEAEQRQTPRSSNQLTINTSTWQAQSLASMPSQTGTWLIWGNEPSTIERLTQQVAPNQRILVCVRDTFAEQSKNLDSTNSQIVYFSNFSNPSAWESAADLLRIAQRVRDLGLNSVKLHVVTSQSLAIAPHEDLNPHDASLRGVAMVLAQEYPEISSHWIDLDFTHQAWPSMLAQELHHASEPAVALRGFNRFVPQANTANLPANQVGFRVGGCYLITGGNGGLGRQIALQLAKQYQAKIAILSRSLAPASSAAQVLQQQIAELGGEALIMQADVAQPKQLAEALALIETQWGHCHGLIHAAGIAGSAAQIGSTETTHAIWNSMMAAKLHGTQQLAMMVRPWKLDWAVVMSSLASDLGGLGFASYASANIAQHAIVHQLNQSSAVPWYCINWDGWQSANEADPQRLSFEQGWAALTAIVQQRGVLNLQVVLGDFAARRQRWLYPQPMVVEQTTVHRPRSANFEAPRTQVEQQLAAIWGDLLGLNELSIHDNFFDLGGHSLLATQILGRIRQKMQVDLALQVVFQLPTLAELAEHIRQQQLSQTLQAQAVGGSEREEIEL